MADNDGSQLRKGSQVVTAVAQRNREATFTKSEPVRVKLDRINCDLAKALPPAVKVNMTRGSSDFGLPSAARQWIL